MSWGATPGYKNISLINTFTFYTHKSGVLFETCPESLNYSYVSELSNRTYVPSVTYIINNLEYRTYKIFTNFYIQENYGSKWRCGKS